jgi:hypothetical protein
MKTRPVVAELFHAAGGTDDRTDGHDKAVIVAFPNFCELAQKLVCLAIKYLNSDRF